MQLPKLATFFMILGGIGAAALVAVLLFTSPWSTFNEQGSQLMAMEWGRISLLDLYGMFFLALVFVWLFEPRLWVKILLTVTLPTLGNPVLAIWMIIRFKHLAALAKR